MNPLKCPCCKTKMDWNEGTWWCPDCGTIKNEYACVPPIVKIPKRVDLDFREEINVEGET